MSNQNTAVNSILAVAPFYENALLTDTRVPQISFTADNSWFLLSSVKVHLIGSAQN